MPKYTPVIDYKQRMKLMRSFVDFDYDLRKPLSPQSKAKINRYHAEYKRLIARPNQIYRARKPKRLQAAQTLGGHDKTLKGFKVAIIQADPYDRAQVKFDSKGKAYTVSNHVTSRLIELDTLALVDDSFAEVERAIAHTNSNAFTIAAGPFEIARGYDAATLPNAINELTTKYSEEDDNHYFGNWLHGVYSHTFTDQSNLGEYLAVKQKAKRAHQDVNKKERRNEKLRASRARANARERAAELKAAAKSIKNK